MAISHSVESSDLGFGEVVARARFRNIFDHSAAGTLGIDIDGIHEVEPAA